MPNRVTNIPSHRSSPPRIPPSSDLISNKAQPIRRPIRRRPRALEILAYTNAADEGACPNMKQDLSAFANYLEERGLKASHIRLLLDTPDGADIYLENFEAVKLRDALQNAMDIAQAGNNFIQSHRLDNKVCHIWH